jgi:alanyl-tRNA synthetase
MTTASRRLSSADLRALFLDFFRQRGHEIVASSSLVPGNDPTLLFTNAGMVQFKDVFLGNDRRGYARAASAQRCVRAGGKHNDLENVGYTARHHTFFEMLGNFSFGDYFKRDAIRYAWDFVTGAEWLGIDASRLMVTVYETDDEAYEVWQHDVGLAPDRIVRIGDNADGGSDDVAKSPSGDNFWQMGDTGPCGPCTEIFYDHGPGIPGGSPGGADADGDRWIEIWNLVFMQYDRAADGTLTPLPKPSVDTGMGLERVAAVMQGVHSNYEIDLFVALIAAAARATGVHDTTSNSLKVIADHIRAAAFLVSDGVLPSNEGRGYVLRRIIRRAIRHGYQLGCTQPFFHKLVEPLVREMGGAYPDLEAHRSHVEKVLLQEEERFAETLTQGMALLEGEIAGLDGRTLPGATVFRLYDTFGFPVDLTADIARERGLEVDHAGFETSMQAQRERARAASRFGVDLGKAVAVDATTEFSGYERLEDRASIVTLLRNGSVQVTALATGEAGEVILERTPFYAESGGQVGDTGVLIGADARFEVTDTRKLGKAHAHIGRLVSGTLHVGDEVEARVDAERRAATVLNHSATHLLHAALREVLGTHVVQKGSLVAPDRLRFDFSHYQPVTPEALAEIERLVNAEIRANAAAETRLMPYEDAIAAGAMALFGEKYDDEVRVLRLGEFSTELCGGTHVRHAGDIGFFKIVSETGVAAGVRRIEAVTGQGALDFTAATDQVLREIGSLVKAGRDDVEDRVRQLVDRARRLEKEVAQLKSKLASGQGTDLTSGAIDVAGVKVVATRIDGADAAALRTAVDQLKDKLKSAAIVLASAESANKVLIIAGVTRDQTSRLKAGELVNAVAQQIGGRGGGRPDLAQAGGTDAARLDEALASVEPWVRARLAS